jgi:hypothetical protein
VAVGGEHKSTGEPKSQPCDVHALILLPGERRPDPQAQLVERVTYS